MCCGRRSDLLYGLRHRCSPSRDRRRGHPSWFASNLLDRISAASAGGAGLAAGSFANNVAPTATPRHACARYRFDGLTSQPWWDTRCSAHPRSSHKNFEIGSSFGHEQAHWVLALVVYWRVRPTPQDVVPHEPRGCGEAISRRRADPRHSWDSKPVRNRVEPWELGR